MSTVEFMTVHMAHGDGGDRSIGPVIGYYSDSVKATDAAKGKGYYGGNGHVSEGPAIRIDGKVYRLLSDAPIDVDGVQASKDDELRKSTLAALSPEQIRVLGIKVKP